MLVIVSQRPSSLTVISMGRTHRAVAAAPSRRLLVLRLSCCARLVPGPDGGGGRETKRGRGLILVRRYARLAVVAELDSWSYLCNDIDG